MTHAPSGLTIGSLFSGIGGLDLGLELAGLGPVVFQVELDPYCRSVLAAHWPNALRFDDVVTVGAAVLPPVDVLCGGFPCQDVSSAGKRAGLGTREEPTERSGLWFQFDRIIGEIRPRWVIIENVASGAAQWVPRVRRDLWARGYASVSLEIAAHEVGGRHRRKRIFVVARLADADRLRRGRVWLADEPAREPNAEGGAPADLDLLLLGQGKGGARGECAGWTVAGGGVAPDAPSTRGGALHPRSRQARQGAPDPERAPAPDSGSIGRDEGAGLSRGREPLAGGEPGAAGGEAVYPGFGLPPLPALVRGVYGFPDGLDSAAWCASGWTPAKIRAARVKALGNSVVPAQVYPVGRLIVAAEAASGDA